MASDQAGQDRPDPPDSTDYVLLSRLGTVPATASGQGPVASAGAAAPPAKPGPQARSAPSSRLAGAPAPRPGGARPGSRCPCPDRLRKEDAAPRTRSPQSSRPVATAQSHIMPRRPPAAATPILSRATEARTWDWRTSCTSPARMQFSAPTRPPSGALRLCLSLKLFGCDPDAQGYEDASGERVQRASYPGLREQRPCL
jgi:hypothetical protein